MLNAEHYFSSILSEYLSSSKNENIPDYIIEDLEKEYPSGEHTSEEQFIGSYLIRSIQNKLPNNYIDMDGMFLTTRKQQSIQPKRLVLFPIHLLTINWGGSFISNQWLQTYHLFECPNTKMGLVVGSLDSCERFGYSDFLLGSFPCQENKQIYAELSGQIICSEWQNLSAFYNQAKWTTVEKEGLISEYEAKGMSYGISWNS